MSIRVTFAFSVEVNVQVKRSVRSERNLHGMRVGLNCHTNRFMATGNLSCSSRSMAAEVMPIAEERPASEEGGAPVRVALLTGATSGIGLAAAAALCARGFHVVVSSRSEERVAEAVSSLHARGFRASGHPCHAGDALARADLLRRARTHGPIHALVVCAATSTAHGPTMDATDAQFGKMLSLNVQAAAATVRDARPHLADGAAVVLVGSIAGYSPLPGLGLYSVTKAALHALVRVLGTELAPEVRVVGVAPGLVRTTFSRVLWEGEGEERLKKMIPMQRLAEAEDIGDVVGFLCSDGARYITSETIVVAGGMHSRL